MKYLVYLTSRIKQYYQSSKVIFSIFAVGTLMLNLLIIYMYGNTVHYMRNKELNTSYYCTYKVNLNGCDYRTLSDELDAILQDINIKDIVFHSLRKEEKTTVSFAASKNNDAGLSNQKLKGRLSFTESEIRNQEQCVIVSYFQNGGYSGINPGEEVAIGEFGTFHVVGVGNFNGDYYVPLTLFESLQLPVYHIDIILKERLPMEAHQPFMDRLSAISKINTESGVSQVIPAYGVSEDIEYFSQNLAEIFILYVFSIAALLFLMQYLTILNRKMDAVSMLVGAPKSKIAFYLFSERFLLSFLAIVFAIVVHRVFYDSVFARFHLTSVYYEWKDYCIIAAIVILSSVIASAAFVISYMRRPAIKASRE